MKSGRASLCAVGALLLAACGPEKTPAELQPRPVKVLRVGLADADTVSVVGVVRARDRAALAFQISGRISAIEAKLGDKVQRGQVVARLDPVPFELRLAQAKAEVARAKAAANEVRARAERQEKLLSDGWVAPAAVEAVRAEAGAAEGALDAARAGEDLARRDLALTVLTAPFDGQVALQLAEPFTEVAAGAPVLELDSANGLEVVAPVPGALGEAFTPGAEAVVLMGGAKTAGIVERISPRSGEAGTIDVIVRLVDASGARAGQTAEVSARRPGLSSGIALPLAALLMSDKPGQGSVFIVKDGKAHRRPVTYNALPGEIVRVVSGLSADEVVVAAGARFLQDGDAVAPQASRVR